jgi:hypothetical protein
MIDGAHGPGKKPLVPRLQSKPFGADLARRNPVRPFIVSTTIREQENAPQASQWYRAPCPWRAGIQAPADVMVACVASAWFAESSLVMAHDSTTDHFYSVPANRDWCRGS